MRHLRLVLAPLSVCCAVVVFSQQQPASEVPPPQQNDYVDSRVCATCHADRAASYALTGMSHSFYRLTPATAIEDFTRNHFYHPASDTHYEMLRRGDEYFQRRYQIQPDGTQTNVDERRIDYVMGSGDHARTYLHQTARGTLQELPLGWYAEKGGYWAMSPGYDFPQHPGSDRLIGYDCMFCHNAYPQIPSAKARFADTPRYTGTLAEGIDCQRCHGPGRAHIEAAKASTPNPEAVRRAIVNPSKLSAERQMEVCLQCHLQPDSFRPTLDFLRYGRSYFSHSPAEPLSNFMVFLDNQTQPSPQRFQIAGSAYRLRQSQCFLKSEGKLQCTTCHDPHDAAHADKSPTGYNPARYNNVCLTCHRERISVLVASDRHPDAPNCVTCHMPKRRTQDVVHVVMTDHLIRRMQPAGDPLAEIPERHDPENKLPGHAVPLYPKRLPATNAESLVTALAQLRNDETSPLAIQQVARLLETRPPANPDPYFELASAERQAGHLPAAIRWFREALNRDPDYSAARFELGKTLHQSGDLKSALEVLSRAAELSPSDPRIWYEIGAVHMDAGKLPDAESALQQAASLDSDYAPPHSALGMVLAETGRLGEAEREFLEAIRIQPNAAQPHANLAQLLALNRNLDQAASEYDCAVRMEPANPELRLKFAQLLYLAGKPDQALEQSTAAVRLQPANPDAHHTKGNLLEKQGRAQEALHEYEEAVRLAPKDDSAQLDLGALLLQAGKRTLGAAHLRIAARSSNPAIRQLAQQLLQQ